MRCTTDGAVRIAPTCFRGKLYFGSDDGYAYCVNADDGSLVWRYSPSSTGRRILHNGRLISQWPCRTGVMIEGNTAHFATGMFPWEPTYLAAVDVQTGKPEGQRRHVWQIRSASCESPLLASPEWLFAPQGRVPPLAIDRETGKAQAVTNERGGGSFALLADDRQLLFGPGNRQVSITQIDMPMKEKPAKPVQFPGVAAVVNGGVIYVLTATKLTPWTAPITSRVGPSPASTAAPSSWRGARSWPADRRAWPHFGPATANDCGMRHWMATRAVWRWPTTRCW